MISLNGYKIEPTIFPDKTSQVWKLPDWLLDTKNRHFQIDWRWENESEVMQIVQLRWMLNRHCNNPDVHLYVPYFPYARQDKNDSNLTFAIYPFIEMLTWLDFTSIKTYDIHNFETFRNKSKWINIDPIEFHLRVIEDLQPYLIVFPDAGAWDRYRHLHDFPHYIICTKVRDQDTGKITGHEMTNGDKMVVDKLDRKKFLVVDDICDGGATFISVAEMIKRINYSLFKDYAYLAVSHGIFSKGLGALTQHYNDFYTTDSLPGSNLHRFKV